MSFMTPLFNSRYAKLTPQAKAVVRFIARAGNVTARDAFLDLEMTSATLARRICDLENVGYRVVRRQKAHPITGKRYTQYAIAG